MIRYISLVLIFFTTPIFAGDDLGKVCFGKNLAKIASEQTDRLYLRINDSEKLFFNRKHEGPVINNLNLEKDHIVKVYFDDVIGMSWKLNFKNLNTQSVIIWRAAGSWRMEQTESETCK